MDVKGVIADHMGHFSAYDIPGLLFVLVAATLFGYLLTKWGANEEGEAARSMAIWSGAAALAAAIVRSQLPMAVLVLAAAVIVGKRNSASSDVLFFSVLLVGLGCGSGATVIVGIALVPYIILLRWAKRPTRT